MLTPLIELQQILDARSRIALLHKCRFAFLVIVFIVISCLALDRLNQNSCYDVDKYIGETTLLIIAHPDDETMFFGPTLLSILDCNKSIIIYCLSNGDADGMGSSRRLELEHVTKALGSSATSLIGNFHDCSLVSWNASQISEAIVNVINENGESIQTVLTFDSYGISGHANHRSIYESLKYLKGSYLGHRLNILTLQSVPILYKYLGCLEATYRLVSYYIFTDLSYSPITLRFSLDWTKYLKLREVLRLHRSQMVWFRYLYMTFSRYMFFNDLEIYQ